jgi:hypothetical protein
MLLVECLLVKLLLLLRIHVHLCASSELLPILGSAHLHVLPSKWVDSLLLECLLLLLEQVALVSDCNFFLGLIELHEVLGLSTATQQLLLVLLLLLLSSNLLLLLSKQLLLLLLLKLLLLLLQKVLLVGFNSVWHLH